MIDIPLLLDSTATTINSNKNHKSFWLWALNADKIPPISYSLCKRDTDAKRPRKRAFETWLHTELTGG
jgi:hypothetical protein